jgi:hypothetical protein
MSGRSAPGCGDRLGGIHAPNMLSRIAKGLTRLIDLYARLSMAHVFPHATCLRESRQPAWKIVWYPIQLMNEATKRCSGDP